MKKGTLIAIGVFAALLILFLATRERHVSEGITRLELPGLNQDKITGLEFSGAKPLTVHKEDGKWVVFTPARIPIKRPTDEEQVRAALDSLPELTSADLVTENPKKFAELEVDDEHGHKVKLMTGSGPVAELIFGKTSRHGTYVRKAGSDVVFSTTSRIAWMSRWEMSSWRKRDFMGVKPEDITQMTVRLNGAEPYTIKAGEGGTWTLAEPQAPAGFRFDSHAAQWMVQQFASLSAQDFAEGMGDDTLGLVNAHDVIEARLKDGKPVTLHLGATVTPPSAQESKDKPAQPKPQMVAVRKEEDAQVYLVSTSVAQGLRKKLTDLRDLSLFQFDPQKVTQLSIEAGGKKTVAVKSGSTWKITEPKKLPDGFEFDPERVVAQISGLRSVRATRWVEPAVSDAEAGLSKPSAVVSIALEGGGSQSVRFGKEITSKTAQELFVKTSADPGLYAIALADRARLEPGLELFKKRPPPPPGAQVQGLENLPPELRRQIEEQLRKGGAHP